MIQQFASDNPDQIVSTPLVNITTVVDDSAEDCLVPSPDRSLDRSPDHPSLSLLACQNHCPGLPDHALRH